MNPPFEWTSLPEHLVNTRPTVLYLALRASTSLHQDPYNQPAKMLEARGIQVLSFSLPNHIDSPPNEGIDHWAKRYAAGETPLETFVKQMAFTLTTFEKEGRISLSQFGVMGLSRGAFVGAHLLRHLSQQSVSPIPLVGFAPLTKLSQTKEFLAQGIDPHLDLERFAEEICSHPTAFYIGNDDSRVGTRHCFTLVEALCRERKQKERGPMPIEMIVGPSYGMHGHGTLPPTFEQGVEWMVKRLEVLR